MFLFCWLYWISTKFVFLVLDIEVWQTTGMSIINILLINSVFIIIIICKFVNLLRVLIIKAGICCILDIIIYVFSFQARDVVRLKDFVGRF